MAKETSETAVLGILKDAGASVDDVIRNKHVKIRWSYRGVKKTTIVPSTASDHRSRLNNIALVRRQIRECKNDE